MAATNLLGGIEAVWQTSLHIMFPLYLAVPRGRHRGFYLI